VPLTRQGFDLSLTRDDMQPHTGPLAAQAHRVNPPESGNVREEGRQLSAVSCQFENAGANRALRLETTN
jgi:hypothetical protein